MALSSALCSPAVFFYARFLSGLRCKHDFFWVVLYARLLLGRVVRTASLWVVLVRTAVYDSVLSARRFALWRSVSHRCPCGTCIVSCEPPLPLRHVHCLL